MPMSSAVNERRFCGDNFCCAVANISVPKKGPAMLDLPMAIFYSGPDMIDPFYENLACPFRGPIFAGDVRFASDD